MKALSLAAGLALLASSAEACAVCFGKAPGSQGVFDGIWWGIVVLLTTVLSMVGGIGWLLYKVEKSRLAGEARG